MELCKGNLKSHFESHLTSVPGRSGRRDHVLQAFKWVIEICSALDYIHNESVVHRDLMLEKILVRNREEPRHCLFYQSVSEHAWVGVVGESIRPLHNYLFLEAIRRHVYAVKSNEANKHGSVGFEDFSDNVEAMV